MGIGEFLERTVRRLAAPVMIAGATACVVPEYQHIPGASQHTLPRVTDSTRRSSNALVTTMQKDQLQYGDNTPYTVFGQFDSIRVCPRNILLSVAKDNPRSDCVTTTDEEATFTLHNSAPPGKEQFSFEHNGVRYNRRFGGLDIDVYTRDSSYTVHDNILTLLPDRGSPFLASFGIETQSSSSTLETKTDTSDQATAHTYATARLFRRMPFGMLSLEARSDGNANHAALLHAGIRILKRKPGELQSSGIALTASYQSRAQALSVTGEPHVMQCEQFSISAGPAIVGESFTFSMLNGLVSGCGLHSHVGGISVQYNGLLSGTRSPMEIEISQQSVVEGDDGLSAEGYRQLYSQHLGRVPYAPPDFLVSETKLRVILYPRVHLGLSAEVRQQLTVRRHEEQVIHLTDNIFTFGIHYALAASR